MGWLGAARGRQEDGASPVQSGGVRPAPGARVLEETGQVPLGYSLRPEAPKCAPQQGPCVHQKHPTLGAREKGDAESHRRH